MTGFDPDKLKHKPNEKHTLDEVLKSLQDLIHNDLLKGEKARLEEPAAPEPAPAPAAEETPMVAALGDANPAAAFPDIPLPAADMPLGAVVQSLEELVKNDLTLADELGQAPTAAPPAPEPLPATPVPATGQQAFAFDDADTRAPAEPGPIPAPLAVEEPEPSAPVAESSDFDELAIELAPPPEGSAPEYRGEAQEPAAEIPADDLPVLTDTVTEAVPPMDDFPVLEEIALESPDNNPAAIAARVIARLNDNRRARGEAELDDATLDMLRMLLREEIERHLSER